MNIADLLVALRQVIRDRAYIARLDVLDQTANILKARLYISPNLFVQVYRNDRFDTTNLVLIYNGQRVYARDQLNGVWHRHTATDPHLHDTSPDGRQQVTLSKFIDEVEAVLATMGLP